MKEKIEAGKKREDVGNNTKLFTKIMEKVDAGLERFHEEMKRLDSEGVTKLRVVVSENAIFHVRDEDLDHRES